MQWWERINTNMRILYIVNRPLEINSSASLRNINTINGLCDLGNEVTVVTGYPSKRHPQYTRICLNPGVRLIHSNDNVSKNISAKISNVPILSNLRGIIYRFSIKQNVYDSWKYVTDAKVWNELNYKTFDVIMSSADPKSSHLTAEMIVDKYHLPWIQVWGDPFTDDITSTNVKLEKKRKREEERLIGKATKVVYLSELTALDMQEKYDIHKNKIEFMPRPYVEESRGNTRKFHGGSVNLSYCGDYRSSVRNILPLYNAILNSNDYLEICGSSDLHIEGNSRIKIRGRVESKKVELIEREADVLVHLSNLKGLQIPGKIYNYSSTDKPILFILDGEKEKIKSCFEKYNRFLFCENDTEAIQDALNIIRCDKFPANLNPVPEFKYSTVLNNLLKM